MQLPFSEADTASTIAPRDPNDHSTVTPHPSSTTADGKADLAAIADSDSNQPVPTLDKTALDKTEPLEVVKQTIDDLEAQGLLMLFDRHDQVAKRLTGDLMAAGILQEDALPNQQETCSHH
ncbi:MAG: hypothetical protein KME45_29765 [Stenomitos rutilans HA7619-LM2]|jgi:hypothetical protein|nr:hypothetical protein [Stenomitos rutilans HA7619-LM2]